MNEALFANTKKRMERTAEALRKNNMAAYCVNHKEEVLPIIKSLLKTGDTVAAGGSQSLAEVGAMGLLSSGDYNYLDRFAEGLTKENIYELFRKAFFADCYLSSSNAITEQGELYNVDGNANRISALIFGPKRVVIVAGYNKIVPDISAAENRVKSICAPANAARLSCKTPCVETGKCQDCKGDSRICCTYSIHRMQREKDRIHVILVAEQLGY